MPARLARALATGLALALLLTGCASADPVTELDDVPSADVDATPAAQALVTLLTEVTAHFAGATQTPTTIISDDATVDVAVAELTQGLDLGDGARDFAAATAFEVARGETVATVEVEAGVPEVVGSHDGLAVAAVAVLQRTARSSGPVTEDTTTYAILLDGDRLADVMAWNPGIDSGVGLASPTGAAQRFVDLVINGDLESARYFSDGVNTDSQLQVLAAAAQGPLTLTELPRLRMGSARVVYALDPQGRVQARFEVLLGSDETKVVYSPTS